MPRLVPAIRVNPVQTHERFDPAIAAADQAATNDYLDSLARTRQDVYALEGPHSFFRDLAAIAEARVQDIGTFSEPRYAALPAPPDNPPGIAWPTPEAAQQRLARSAREQRDISSSSGSVPDLLRAPRCRVRCSRSSARPRAARPDWRRP